MNKLAFFFIFLLVSNVASAQKITPADLKILHKKEDSLKTLSLKIIQGRTSSDRFMADSEFTKIFVRALRVKNSFHYPFDSLITISKLSPPDSSFKIIRKPIASNAYL